MFEKLLEVSLEIYKASFKLKGLPVFYSKEKVRLSSGEGIIIGFSLKECHKYLILAKEFNPAIAIIDNVIYRVKAGKHEIFMCGKTARLKWKELLDIEDYSINTASSYIYIAIPKDLIEELIEFLKGRHVELDAEKFDVSKVYFKDSKIFIDDKSYYKVSVDIFRVLYNLAISPGAFVEVLLQLHTKMTQEKSQENTEG